MYVGENAYSRSKKNPNSWFVVIRHPRYRLVWDGWSKYLRALLSF